jgi:hypothetical protein
MVQVSTLLAAAGCLLSSSSVFVSCSPLVATERDVAAYTVVDGPIEWRGTLEEGQEPVYLSGNSFEVCFHLLFSLEPATVPNQHQMLGYRGASEGSQPNLHHI